jgi:hypothetical protein
MNEEPPKDDTATEQSRKPHVTISEHIYQQLAVLLDTDVQRTTSPLSRNWYKIEHVQRNLLPYFRPNGNPSIKPHCDAYIALSGNSHQGHLPFELMRILVSMSWKQRTLPQLL